MANPNGINPSYLGKVTATGFDATHAGGVSVTAVTTTSSVAVFVFGAQNPFKGTITGVWGYNLSGSSNVITITNDGVNVGNLFTGPADEAFMATKALSNMAISLNGSITVVSDGALTGNAVIFFAYKVSDNLT